MCDPLSLTLALGGGLLAKDQANKAENAMERAQMAAEEERKKAEAKAEEDKVKAERTMQFATKRPGAKTPEPGRFSLRLFDSGAFPSSQRPSGGPPTLGVGR